ncbi:MAG: hypothetical protein ACD_74C00132G0002 [uncultured bacterium]|nr:MAG: hypothetical protein ACD_74C00132G0002 [uncultured bacterium]
MKTEKIAYIKNDGERRIIVTKSGKNIAVFGENENARAVAQSHGFLLKGEF